MDHLSIIIKTALDKDNSHILKGIQDIEDAINKSGGIKLKIDFDKTILNKFADVSKQLGEKINIPIDVNGADGLKTIKQYYSGMADSAKQAYQIVTNYNNQMGTTISKQEEYIDALRRYEVTRSSVTYSEKEHLKALEKVSEAERKRIEILDTQKGTEAAKNSRQWYRDDENRMRSFSDALKSQMETAAQLENITQRINNLQSKINNSLLGNNSPEDNTALQNLSSNLQQVDTNSEGATRRITDLNTSYKNLISDMKKGNIVNNDMGVNFNSSDAELKNYISKLRDISVEQISIKNSSQTMFGNDGSVFRVVSAQIDEGSSKFKNLTYSINNTNGQVRELEKNTTDANKSFVNLEDSLKKVVRHFISIYQLLRLFRDGIKTISEYDNQMNSIRMITGMTADEAERLRKEYQQTATELSATGLEIAKIVETFARQGRSQAEVNTLIKDTTILAKTGFMETQEAAELLTSAINGYGLSASDAATVVDKLSAMDSRAATTAKEMAEAMRHTAAGAKLAGVSMDSLLAYMATVQEKSGRTAQTVGDAFKTMFSRIQQVKLGKLTDDLGDDISNVDKVLKQYNIALRDAQGNFRNTEIVLKELSEQWVNYGSTQKREIAGAIAGVRQSEQFLILMENFPALLS